jgi:hypothetical protein
MKLRVTTLTLVDQFWSTFMLHVFIIEYMYMYDEHANVCKHVFHLDLLCVLSR